MSTRKLVIGNWKMTGTRARVRSFAETVCPVLPDLQRCEAVVCVPFPLLSIAQAAWKASALRLGAQECSSAPEGPSTGDVSAEMIAECGTRHVIVGHSERRAGHRESDIEVAAKARRVLDAGMTPIACIGETAEQRDDNRTEAVLRQQVLQLARVLKRDMRSVILAYEPLWAIGSGDSAAVAMIEEVHEFIERVITFHGVQDAAVMRTIYGGSVHPRNAASILDRQRVGGVLVGGASQRADDFLEICKAAARCAAESPP
jgi:triosephosphate isomerase (TIM)